MVRSFRKLGAVALSAAILSGCASSGPGASDIPLLGAVTASNQTTVDGLRFPLPNGVWNKVWTYEVPGGRSKAPQTFQIYASVNEGVIDRAAVFWVQRKSTFIDLWRRYEACLDANDDNVLHAVIAKNTGGSQPGAGVDVDCWHIRVVSMGRQGAPHPTIAALQALADRDGLYLPVTMLSTRFAQKREIESRDYADYLYNADFLAPKPDGSPWLPDEWSKSAVAADRAKSLVVERLTRWGEGWRPRLTRDPSS